MAVTKTKGATKTHIQLVLSDPEFISRYNELNGKSNRRVWANKLLQEYGVTLDDFSIHENGYSMLVNQNRLFSAGWLDYNPESQEFVARFKVTIKRDEFDDLWALVQKNKDRLKIHRPKLREPDDPKLLYAIFKARKSQTFFQIFKLYQAGKLPYYDQGVTNQFPSEDALERYYHRYYKSVTADS